jgi:hypothetical protein
MPYLFERHRVRDYARWREVFDADTENREAAGCRGARIFRNTEDPEEVVVLATTTKPIRTLFIRVRGRRSSLST